jgi:hypothetical protein
MEEVSLDNALASANGRCGRIVAYSYKAQIDPAAPMTSWLVRNGLRGNIAEPVSPSR